jgi:thiol-disulfide isomerase/thioredoxin
MMRFLCATVILFAVTALAVTAVRRDDDDPKPKAKAKSATQPAEVKKLTVYDEKADGKQLIETALTKAKRENRRVLIQWGGNWCSWCLLLHERFRTDRNLAKVLRYEYEVVHIDSKNKDLMKQYGADRNDGVPYLTVLDAGGKVLINQSTVPFETKVDGVNGHDPAKLLDFLIAHEAPPLKAAAVLDAALAEAAKTDRRVMLHFGAPWCGWCLKLDAWLATPEIAKVMGKDYVEVKIDNDRMTGAKEVFARFNPSQEGGIPWFVMLDAAGKPIVTSDGPKGNIGFPATDDEIAYFVKMLQASKKRLTDADIRALEASLTAQKQ